MEKKSGVGTEVCMRYQDDNNEDSQETYMVRRELNNRKFVRSGTKYGVIEEYYEVQS